MPRQITIRGVSDDLARRLRELAKARGESMNTVALELLERATGAAGRRDRLARYVTWTDQDREEFERTLEEQRKIDEELWR